MEKDGGPAFPSLEVFEGYDRDREESVVKSEVATGMSLRDYFAACALQGVIVARSSAGLDIGQESIAEECYELADAMLEAREAKRNDG